jgi:two-component system sensor histidine kinase DesK
VTVSRWWNQRSSPQRLDAYIRWSLYLTSASLVPIALLPITSTPDANPAALAAMLTVMVAQTIACIALLRAGLSTLLGGPPPDRRLVIATVALTGAGLLAAFWAFADPAAADFVTIGLIAAVFGGSLTSALTPVLNRRALYAGIGIGAAITAAWYAVAGGDDRAGSLGMGLFYAVVVGFVVGIDRISEWMLVLIWEIDASRTVQARLAVAEERLRFARDFHDVLGRNLTLIAVTSDLAAGLARRGDPHAVDKMLEVRRIAHESAREVREVVTGYRATDLDTELTGARSVLRAAGINTRIIGDSTCIPGDAQVAFAWVLREATTNVIRHSNATTCTIELGSQPRTEAGATDTAVMQIRNDGSPTPEPFHAPGHGLAGLRERMTALGGHFAAGPQPGGWFTVDARLPMTQNAPVMTGESAP